MTIEVFILGTSHPLQCGSAECTKENIVAFEKEVRSLCKKLSVKRIAEEMTVEGLAHNGVTETIPQRIARDIAVPVQHVDLQQKDRSTLSINDSTVINTVRRHGIFDGGPFREAFDDLADGVRERVWVARMLSRTEWPVLFVCGSEHAASVRRLFRGLGIDSTVVHLDYEP